MSVGSGTGHGKVILLGEHAVVHGQPAIAAGVSRCVRVTIRRASPAPAAELRPALAAAAAVVGDIDIDGLAVSIEGDLPVAVGLGSSAALSVALVRGLAAFQRRALHQGEVARMANEVDRVFHGTPSGVDAAAASLGGVLWFEAGPPPHAEPLPPAGPIPMVVALSGTRHHTGHSVGELRRRAEALPQVYAPIFHAIGELVRAGRTAIEDGAWPLLGELMSMNHGLLRCCNVSTPVLDRVVEDAKRSGALGAKLTGAGGGGAVIALADGSPDDLAARLVGRGWEAFVA